MNTRCQTELFPDYGSAVGIPADHPFFLARERLQKPALEKNGKTKTRNCMGFMAAKLQKIMEEFLQFSKGASLPVLDVGAAYGIASIAAAKQGNTVIANDIETQHLIAISQADALSREEKKRIFLNKDMAPDQIDLPESSVHAILFHEVIHFFLPEAIERFFEKASRWLSPGGRLFMSSMSPYHQGLGNFLETYEERWRAGDPWPGMVENVTTSYFPEHKGKIPQKLHTMDLRPLLPVLSKNNFFVKKMFLFDSGVNVDTNGNGHIGLVLIKSETKI